MSPATPKLTAVNDRELASRARGGCCVSFEELVRRYEGRLFNFILRRVANAADAEDVVQQAFVKAWQAIDRYDPRWQFSTWLHTIAIRLACSAAHQNMRRRMTARGAAHLPKRSPVDPATCCEDREARENIWALADQVLEVEPRSALWLHYAEDMAPREIARVLGRTSVAVRVMLHRARKRLAEHAGGESAPDATDDHRHSDAVVVCSGGLAGSACTKGESS